jgi:hypothetical protein
MALSVIVWGTAYKTSLYKSSAEQGKAPAAKLCTRASEVAKSEVDASVHHVPATVVHPLATSVALLTEVERQAHAVPVQRPRPRAFLAVRTVPALFFRPPPSI